MKTFHTNLMKLREAMRKGTISQEEFMVKSLDVANQEMAAIVAMKPSITQEMSDHWSELLAKDLVSHFIALN